MTYHTEDAIELWQSVKERIREHGPDNAFAHLTHIEPELLALTLTLAVHSTSPLSQ